MKISIITVCKNAQDYIEKTIQSVLDQTYQNIEYIIVDGESTDNTIDIIARYKNNESLQMVSEADSGIYAAMNKGVSLSHGDILYFLNAGDFFMNNAILDIVSKNFNETNADIIYGKCIYKDIPEKRKRRYTKNVDFKSDTIWDIAKNSAPQQCFFYRKTCFEKIGTFNSGFTIAGDLDWILRAAKSKLKMHFIDKFFVEYSLSGISCKPGSLKYAERLKALKKNLNFIELAFYFLLAIGRNFKRKFC